MKGFSPLPISLSPLLESEFDEDAGGLGKSFEIAFAKCLTLAGLKFKENGLRGKGGALWDFAPRGLKWKNLPDGALVNLKVHTARTLFTSTDFWKKVFLKDLSGKNDKQVESLIRRRLRDIGFSKVYWLKPKDAKIEKAVMRAANRADKKLAQEVLKGDNWSVSRLARYTVEWVTGDKAAMQKIHLKSKGKLYATIAVRVNAKAKNTAGWARISQHKPKAPFVAIKSEKRLETFAAARDLAKKATVPKAKPYSASMHELFDKPYPYSVEAGFKSKFPGVRFKAAVKDSDQVAVIDADFKISADFSFNNRMNIEFSLLWYADKDGKANRRTVSNNYDALKDIAAPSRVFATVIDVARKILKTQPEIEAIEFFGKGASRTRLYQVMAKKFANQLGWKIRRSTVKGETQWLIVKPS